MECVMGKIADVPLSVIREERDDRKKEGSRLQFSSIYIYARCRVLIEGSRKESATGGKMDSHDGSARFPRREPRLDLRGTPRAIITAGG